MSNIVGALTVNKFEKRKRRGEGVGDKLVVMLNNAVFLFLFFVFVFLFL